MKLVQEFVLSRGNRNKNATPLRINDNAVNHIVTFLLPYYPELKHYKKGERTDFVIFLLEKSLKEKIPDYKPSWNCEKDEIESNMKALF